MSIFLVEVRFPHSARKQNRSAFTLTEVMVTVVVVGLLAAGAVLQVVPQVQQAWVEEAAATLGFHCQEAHSMAVSDNRPVVLSVDDEARSLTIWKDEDLDDVRDSGEEEVVQLSDRNGVTLLSDWSSGVFSPTGQFMTFPLSRTLSTVETTVSSAKARRARTIRIQGSGGIQLL